MREAKRVLLAPALWGLLAFLLVFNIMLTVTQDWHDGSYYVDYCAALARLKRLPVPEKQSGAAGGLRPAGPARLSELHADPRTGRDLPDPALLPLEGSVAGYAVAAAVGLACLLASRLRWLSRSTAGGGA